MALTLRATADCSAAGAICAVDGRSLSNTVSATVTGPPGLTVADARVEEGATAVLAFAVSLDRAASGPVTVDYRTIDGTAKAAPARPARSRCRLERRRRRSRWRCPTTRTTRGRRR